MTTLTLGQAVRNCIVAERAAERFYRGLATDQPDEEVRAFLLDMARQEVEHAATIERFAESEAAIVPARADRALELVEAAPAWERAGDLTLAQALDVAIECEGHAALYYDILADQTPDDVSRFFRMLAKAEEQHLARLQALQARKLGRRPRPTRPEH